MKNKGFTLVEMMISISVFLLIISFLSEFIRETNFAYNTILESSEAKSKIIPFLNRIEYNLIEIQDEWEFNKKPIKTYIEEIFIKNSIIRGIKIKGNYTYFFDNNSIYRGSDFVSSNSRKIFSSNSIYLEDLFFEIYENNEGKTKIKTFSITNGTESLNKNEIAYLKINVKIKGKTGSNFNFSTGFSLP